MYTRIFTHRNVIPVIHNYGSTHQGGKHAFFKELLLRKVLAPTSIYYLLTRIMSKQCKRYGLNCLLFIIVYNLSQGTLMNFNVDIIL